MGWLVAAVLASSPALAQQGGAAPSKPSPLSKPAAQATAAKADTGAAKPQKAAEPAAKKAAPGRPVTKAEERRDPFRSMLQPPKAAGPLEAPCPPGPHGIPIGPAELRGLVRSQDGTYTAIVLIAGRVPAYFLHEGDAVCNGVVQSITTDSIVFVENVIDALGRPGKREVIKKIPAAAK
jgi:hypothetical protein